MGLTVYTKQRSIRIDTGNGIVEIIAVSLVKADRKHNGKLPRKPHSHLHRVIFLHRLCIGVKIITSLLAEVFPFKKLRQQYDLRSHLRRFPDLCFRRSKILFYFFFTAHLNGCHLHFAHIYSFLSLKCPI